MSNNLNINMTQTQLNNIQANPVTGNMTSQFKIAGLDKENDTTAVEMKISKIGRLKFEYCEQCKNGRSDCCEGRVGKRFSRFKERDT